MYPLACLFSCTRIGIHVRRHPVACPPEQISALKLNRCVRCGAEEYLTRFHVVPHMYRKYLPLHIKNHSTHDVVVLCASCHYVGNQVCVWA